MQRLQRLLAESDSCIKEKQNNIVLVKERNDKLLQERQANMTTIAALTKSNHQLEQQCQSLDRQVQTLNNDVRHQSDYGDALLAKIKQFEVSGNIGISKNDPRLCAYSKEKRNSQL